MAHHSQIGVKRAKIAWMNALVLQAKERVGHASSSRPTCAPDPVHVVLDGQWETEVEDTLHAGNVQPTRSHWRGVGARM